MLKDLFLVSFNLKLPTDLKGKLQIIANSIPSQRKKLFILEETIPSSYLRDWSQYPPGLVLQS